MAEIINQLLAMSAEMGQHIVGADYDVYCAIANSFSASNDNDSSMGYSELSDNTNEGSGGQSSGQGTEGISHLNVLGKHARDETDGELCACGDLADPSCEIRGMGKRCDKCNSYKGPEKALKQKRRSHRCECDRAVPSFGLPGDLRKNARWCSLCPSRPSHAVDVVSKRCECGTVKPSFGLPGDMRKDARWCNKCPGKPAHAINVVSKKCECGRVQPSFGLPGDQLKDMRWCSQCPKKAPAAVNLRSRPRKGSWDSDDSSSGSPHSHLTSARHSNESLFSNASTAVSAEPTSAEIAPRATTRPRRLQQRLEQRAGWQGRAAVDAGRGGGAGLQRGAAIREGAGWGPDEEYLFGTGVVHALASSLPKERAAQQYMFAADMRVPPPPVLKEGLVLADWDGSDIHPAHLDEMLELFLA